VLGILNGIEQVVSASPALVEALYDNPTSAIHAWSSLLMLLDHDDPEPLLPVLDAALAAADERAIAIVRSFFPGATLEETP
jgi:hypothetical protein